MLKMFLSDLDGTLLKKGESELSEYCKRKLLALTNSGVEFAVVSGRDIISLRKLFAFLPAAYLAGCNGAVCVKGEKTLYSRPISPATILSAWKYADKTRQNAVFCSDDTLFVMGDKGFVSDVEKGNEGHIKTVRSNSDISGRIYKISFYDKSGFGGLSEPPFDVRICYERNGWREYVNRFAGKGDAAFDLQMRLGLGRASCAAAGNELSDSELLMRAGYRFSFCDLLAKETGAVRVSSVIRLFDELDRI